ncbi:MAG: pro-sigmaK processing inhibitor BofA family protein [Bacillota bacterium]|nr:pro-sigmaK processing inhibitor BofA family protein [Bacillota bacterium]
MDIWQNVLWVSAGLAVIFLISIMPQRAFVWCGRFLLNAALGLALLLLVNLCSPWTQLILPLNALTVAVSGLLGLPGMAALTVLAAV